MKQQRQMRNKARVSAAATAAGLAVASGGGVVIATGAVSPIAARAQVPFQVQRPENGATVRETVRIRIPRSALGTDVKYLSLSIDNRFRAAVAVPDRTPTGKATVTPRVSADNNAVTLLWDTKAPDTVTPYLTDEQRIIRDGSHTIEVVAQGAAGQRLGRQLLTVNVNNKGGFSIPSDGVAFNYQFRVGDTTAYKQTTQVDYITDGVAAAAQTPRQPTFGGFGGGGGFGGRGGMGGGGRSGGRGNEEGGPPPGYGGPPPGYGGGRGGNGGPPPGYGGGDGGYTPAAQASGPVNIPVQTVKATYERTVEDYLNTGAYFLRDRVLDGSIVSAAGGSAFLNNVYLFKSRYRTIAPSGQLVNYGVASSAKPGAYVALPIVNLGGGRRRVGSKWTTATPVLLEWATLDIPPYVRAENTFEGLEWQDGYQTARVRQTYKGKANIPIYGGAGMMRGADVDMDRTIWFSYKAGKVIRSETTVQVSGNAPSDILAAMVPGANVGGGYGQGAPVGAGFGGGDEGGAPGGFGSAQTTESPRVPAKFRSVTTVTVAPPAKSAQLQARR